MQPRKFEDKFNTILVFDSSAAVGLLVADNFEAKKGHTGAFISPELAREIAAALIESAENAEANRVIVHSPEERRKLLNRAMGRDENDDGTSAEAERQQNLVLDTMKGCDAIGIVP
jgi:hypothetical protein